MRYAGGTFNGTHDHSKISLMLFLSLVLNALNSIADLIELLNRLRSAIEPTTVLASRQAKPIHVRSIDLQESFTDPLPEDLSHLDRADLAVRVLGRRLATACGLGQAA